jgi:hypothetical protein
VSDENPWAAPESDPRTSSPDWDEVEDLVTVLCWAWPAAFAFLLCLVAAYVEWRDAP